MPSHEYERLPFDPETQENLPTKERYVFNCKAITITGRPGSGQSSAAEELAKLLGRELYDVGKIDFRAQAEIDIVDFYERPIDKDEKVDNKQKELIKNATFENPLLLESKLAGILTKELLDSWELQPEDVVNIFVSCPRDIRYDRILQREIENGNMHYNKKIIGEETRHRELADRMQWGQLHPKLSYIDPFDPNAKDESGERIYKFVVSSARESQIEVAKEMKRRLIEAGYIRKISDKESTQLPNQGSIFQAN